MPPNQTPYTPPSGQPNSFDFIMGSGNQPKRNLLAGGSQKQRIIIAAVLAVVVLVIGFVVFSFAGSGKGNTEALVDIAKQQTELIRIAGVGQTKARGNNARALASTAKLALITDQKELLDHLSKNGRKVDEKELVLGKNTKTDEMLTAAEQSGRFDEIFVSELQKQLTTYRQAMKQAYDGSANKTARALLAADYKATALLVGASN